MAGKTVGGAFRSPLREWDFFAALADRRVCTLDVANFAHLCCIDGRVRLENIALAAIQSKRFRLLYA